MKLSVDIRIHVAFLAVLSAFGLFMAAFAGDDNVSGQEQVMPIKNLRLPMEYYENGVIKTQLKAGVALVPPHGMITASNVVMEMFFEDGSTNVIMLADSCLYDRAAQSATSDGKIKIIRGNITLTGKGFEWHSDTEKVKVLSDAKIVMLHNPGEGSTFNFLDNLKKKVKK